MKPNDDRRARRTALRILAILAVVVTLSCIGGVTFFQGTLGEVQHGLTDLDGNLQERMPAGAVWEFAELTAATEDRPPEETVHLVLAIGLPDGTDAGDPAALRDAAWHAYCDAFPDGGLHLGSIAIGTAAGKRAQAGMAAAGHVTDWDGEREDVSALAERTGRAAPEDLALVRWFGNAIRIRDDG